MKEKVQPTTKPNKRTRSSQKDIPSDKKLNTFPVIGIGASAGGLEALEQFLRHMPADNGIAFVIIQHLDPTHKGIMAELLGRTTEMQVIQARDRVRIKPNCVYVIPPNKDMSILHGVLHLFNPTAPRGLRLPIDFFLRSLSLDRQAQAIGVILSGMGSDGTMGLRAIKEKGGVALVQEPASAKFDSMPRSAIAAGLADIVAPPEELPVKIIAYLRHALVIANNVGKREDKDQSSLEKILILLRMKTGHDFSLYKKNTLYRRIERRMGIHQIDRISTYVRFLQENAQEQELLFKEFLIGVTNFFRDPTVWDQLGKEVIPALLANIPSGGVIRVWTAGCSTGEEAYSLAIVCKEALEAIKPAENFRLQIFGTDLDKDAIDKARQGSFPANIAADVSPERLNRFFVREETGYRISKNIRETVTFAIQNVIMDPPFTKLDILICRNLLIYLSPELQKRLLQLFHYSLKPGGVLFLGSAESINNFTDLFEPLNLKSRLFRRLESTLTTERFAFADAIVPTLSEISKEITMVKPVANLQSLADQLLLQNFSPPAVLVNDKGDILYISGRTGKYIEPAAGKANWNIFAMVREGLRFELGSAFQKAIRGKVTITVNDLKVLNNGSTQIVDIIIQPVQKPEALRGTVLIVFIDVATKPNKKASGRSKTASSGQAGILELEQELRKAREDLESMREDMQSSQEELNSSNEELQSTNEELQSTNEEITTSREEMQSMNEELQTVNVEQQSKLDELARVNNDMRNLLNSTEIVTVFLDNELHVRSFTPGANKLFKLLPGDVGRPLSDIVSDLIYADMIAEAREVLRTLIFSQKQITTKDGRWFSVRIMPYRTMDDVIDGVVITFADITETKQLEAQLREENAKLKSLFEAGGQ